MILVDSRAVKYPRVKSFLVGTKLPIVYCDPFNSDKSLEGSIPAGAVLYDNAEDEVDFWRKVFVNYPNATVLLTSDEDATAQAAALVFGNDPALHLVFNLDSDRIEVVG